MEDEVLYHYGIRGMKWRFHRKGKKDKKSEGDALRKAASKVPQEEPATLKEVAERNAKETREKKIADNSASAARRDKFKTLEGNKLHKRNSLSTSGMRSEKTKQKAKERVAATIKKSLSIASARKENPKVKNFIKKTTVRFMRFRTDSRG